MAERRDTSISFYKRTKRILVFMHKRPYQINFSCLRSGKDFRASKSFQLDFDLATIIKATLKAIIVEVN
jgi:hypothetical protein